jgi:hypothetical protein
MIPRCQGMLYAEGRMMKGGERCFGGEEGERGTKQLFVLYIAYDNRKDESSTKGTNLA